MKSIAPGDISSVEVYRLLAGAVYPRPIALVATCSATSINLAPFSFFNVFSVAPPVVAFAPLSRLRDGSKKDTVQNLSQLGECTIQVVSEEIVDQVNLCASDFDKDVNEFVKSGLTPLESEFVKPPRVAESPVQMECKLKQLIELGDQPGSGTMVVCEVLKFHIQEAAYRDGNLDADQMNLVGRCGGDAYVRANSETQFDLAKPGSADAVGFDQLPKALLNSELFTGKDLTSFARLSSLPSGEEAKAYVANIESDMKGKVAADVSEAMAIEDQSEKVQELMLCAHEAFARGELEMAINIATYVDQFGS